MNEAKKKEIMEYITGNFPGAILKYEVHLKKKFHMDFKLFFPFVIFPEKPIKNYSPIMCRHPMKHNGHKCLV